MVLSVLELEESSFCRVRVYVCGAFAKGCNWSRLLLWVVFIVRIWFVLLMGLLLLFCNWRRCLNRALLLRCNQSVRLGSFNKTFHKLVLLFISKDFTHDFSLVLVIDFWFWLTNMEGILHLMLRWWICGNTVTSHLWWSLWLCFVLSYRWLSCLWELYCWPSVNTLEA
jgi:hypothetical protein